MTYGIQELDRAYADGMEDLGQKIIELLDEAMAADEEISPTDLIEFIEEELSFDPGEVDEDILIDLESSEDEYAAYLISKYYGAGEAVQS